MFFSYAAGMAQRMEARRLRERDLVVATRALFDERGMQDAPIEEIAQAVGIARGLIYRQFSSKEELFVLTVTDYLDELDGVLSDAIRARTPERRLEQCAEAYARFCLRYPAFLDCSLSLMHRPARELREIVSDSVWLRLGQGMAACIDQLTRILVALEVAEADFVANVLWTQTLGAMHLARIRIGLRQVAPGIPELFRIEPELLVRTCVESARATVEIQQRRR
jgi:AcrR family transcriptional regulator